jgi:hypothetical protein
MINVDTVKRSTTVTEFDQSVTAPTFGFSTADEYYRFASCVYDLPYLNIPTLLLSAMDDPISHQDLIPYNEVKVNPNIVLALTANGGHLGWFEATGILPRKRWIQKPIVQFIHALFQSNLSHGPPLNIKSKAVKIPESIKPKHPVYEKVMISRGVSTVRTVNKLELLPLIVRIVGVNAIVGLILAILFRFRR